MNTGLLWHDRRSAAEAVPAATARYVARCGRTPNVCYVHPTTAPDGAQVIAGVQLKVSRRVLPFHFWVGTETAVA